MQCKTYHANIGKQYETGKACEIRDRRSEYISPASSQKHHR